MKISFLAPHLKLSGGVRIILKYADLLARRGHEVTVYAQSNNQLRRSVANFLQIGKPKWAGNFTPRVLRIVDFSADNVVPADVLIATTVKTALALDILPDGHGKQFYLLQHDEGLYHASREDADRAYRGRATKIVVATWLQELLKNNYDIEAKLLLNPVDLSQFHKLPREINDGTVRILVLHHNYEWKGTAEGVTIVQELKKKYPQIRLVMFGVREKTLPEGMCDEYHYNLPQEKLAWLYSNVDIFLCPSWDEGFGLPSVEAMACGAALATYDNGGSRDFAHHGVTAMVAPNRDKIALRERLEALVSDGTLRERIAGEGQKFVSTMPSWNERVMELEKILSQTK